MQIPVWIEPIPESGFRATSGLPLALTADGSTEAEALLRLRKLLQDRLGRGGRLLSLDASEVIEKEPPYMRFAGGLKEEPLFDAWQEAMREYRQQADEADQTG